MYKDGDQKCETSEKMVDRMEMCAWIGTYVIVKKNLY